ncbi:reverse transcriptase [Corchorus capsularis]|uniref:Reverse transcriptase n=1 Tax=Corchorus capsularis TaxID=210143 RepID=A0A1R3H3U0_COCAP|nr:reverse transcriptase [Corchorus capsularis]
MTFVKKGGRDARVKPEYPDWHQMRVKDIKVPPPTDLEAAVGEEMEDIVMKLTMQLKRQEDDAEAQRIAEVNRQLMIRIEEVEKKAEEMSTKCREAEEEVKGERKLKEKAMAQNRVLKRDFEAECRERTSLAKKNKAAKIANSYLMEKLDFEMGESSKNAYDQRCEQIRFLLDQIRVGLLQVKDIRDQARDVLPCLAPFGQRLQPVADSLEDTVSKCNETLVYFRQFETSFHTIMEEYVARLQRVEQTQEELRWDMKNMAAMIQQLVEERIMDKLPFTCPPVVGFKPLIPDPPKFPVRPQGYYLQNLCHSRYSGVVKVEGETPFYPKPQNKRLRAPRAAQQGNSANQPGSKDLAVEEIPIDPIPYTYTELLPQLLQRNLVQRLPYSKPFAKAKPWYNPNAHCDYYSGTKGHFTEDCIRLKYAVQELVRDVTTVITTKVTKLTTPFNTIQWNTQKATWTGQARERESIDPIPYTYTEMLPQLLQQRLLERLPYAQPLPLNRRPRWYNADARYDYHSGTEGHTIEDCLKLKYAVQELVRNGKLSFGKTAQADQTQEQSDNQVSMVGSGEVLRKKTIRGRDTFWLHIQVAPFLLLLPALVVVPPQPFPYELGGIHINNGSALNIMTLNTLRDLPVKPAFIQVGHRKIRTPDEEMREVIGEVEICMEIGSTLFSLLFQVGDMEAPYTCLLGRPWVHSAQEATKVTPTKSQEGVIISETGTQSYGHPFQVNKASHAEEMKKDVTRCWMEGQSLGKDSQDKTEIVGDLTISPGFGLGFKPIAKDHQMLDDARKMMKAERLDILRLSQTFRSAGWVSGESQPGQKEEAVIQKKVGLTINAITKEGARTSSWIYPLAAGEGAPREVKIGITLSEEDRQELIDLLKEFSDVFAWSYQDMPAKYPEWQANIVPVPKKDGKVRMCVDYRDLNKASSKDNFPLRHIDILVDNTVGYSWFSFMDGFSGYNQIKMAPEDMEKTAFVTAWRVFCYKVMPFGLKNAGATYQRAMVALFHDMMHKEIEVYVDDMIAKARMPKEHNENLRKLFERLRKVQLKLNPNKCTFGATSGKLLGFVVSEKGIEVDPDKIQAIQGLLPHKLKKKSTSIGPTNKGKAFNFENSMGCVLAQQHDTDPIKYVFEKPGLSGWIARWQVLLSEYYIVYVSQKTIKGSVIADFRADRTREEYEPMNFEFPDENLIPHVKKVEKTEEKWIVYFDGDSNLSGQGIGAVLVSPEEYYYPATARLKFPTTNNVAEYEACVLGIQLALERKVKRVEIYGDSALVIYQMKGEWQARDSKLVLYKDHVSEMIKSFEEVTFHHLPSEDNQMADVLETMASMFKIGAKTEIQPIYVQTRNLPAHVMSVEDKADGNPWYFDILQYLKKQINSEHATEVDKRTLKRMAAGYFLSGETLYKNGWDGTLMRCVDSAEARKILEEIHGGSYGSHANGHRMARQIIREDVIGMITPKASNGHQFILMAIDYFTKWVEAASYPSVTQVVVARFINKEIICRPKMNGAVEAANKNIKKILEKMIVTYRDWHEKLPFALHTYQTCVRTSTEATPYSLVYGMEAVVPIERLRSEGTIKEEHEGIEAEPLKQQLEIVRQSTEMLEGLQNRYLNDLEVQQMTTMPGGLIYHREEPSIPMQVANDSNSAESSQMGVKRGEQTRQKTREELEFELNLQMEQQNLKMVESQIILNPSARENASSTNQCTNQESQSSTLLLRPGILVNATSPGFICTINEEDTVSAFLKDTLSQRPPGGGIKVKDTEFGQNQTRGDQIKLISVILRKKPQPYLVAFTSLRRLKVAPSLPLPCRSSKPLPMKPEIYHTCKSVYESEYALHLSLSTETGPLEEEKDKPHDGPLVEEDIEREAEKHSAKRKRMEDEFAETELAEKTNVKQRMKDIEKEDRLKDDNIELPTVGSRLAVPQQQPRAP